MSETNTQIIVAECDNRFITWISEGGNCTLLGDKDWVDRAHNASLHNENVSLFDNLLVVKANLESDSTLISVFASLASFAGDRIKIRHCPVELKEHIRDTVATDYFSEMLGKNLSHEEWSEFLSSSTYEFDTEKRWDDSEPNISSIIKHMLAPRISTKTII